MKDKQKMAFYYRSDCQLFQEPFEGEKLHNVIVRLVVFS